MNSLTLKDRMLGGLWGALVGDALGVPVEFRGRASVQQDPVTGMRGFGTHNQPPGTWSDDSSLLLCTAESLANCGGFDAHDLAARFVRWEREGHWTPHGDVFDIGIATSQAIRKLANGTPPEEAGGIGDYDNGNGSLMRILPVALWFDSSEAVIVYAHRASALTHRHPRSQIACALYCLLVREILSGAHADNAFRAAVDRFAQTHNQAPFVAERLLFTVLESGRLGSLPEKEIDSSGYVMHTLTAAIWCLLTSHSFEETVLKAVNLGGDTDTTGTVAGGLAGVLYGIESIPSSWRHSLAREGDVSLLFDEFISKIEVLAECRRENAPAARDEIPGSPS